MLASFTSSLNNFHGLTAYLVVAGLVVGESGLVVGFFFPGEIAVVVGGVLAKTHHVNLVIELLVAVGAAIGAFTMGYAVGTVVGPWLLDHRPLKGRPAVAKVEHLLERFGGPAVFVGRFLAFARAIIPAIVGTSEVRFRTFMIFNVLGGVVWAVTYTLIGYAVGTGYSKIVTRIGYWSFGIVAVALVGWFFWHRFEHRRTEGRF